MLDGLRDLLKHRALVGVLVARELKARYRGSVLGYFWSLLNPLLMLAVYVVVFQLIFPGRSPSTSPYALFLFCGLLPWNWLAGSLTDASASLVVHGPLLKKVLFPAEVLPTVAVLAQGVHFLLALPVLGLGLVLGAGGVFGAAVPLTAALLQVPGLILLEGLFVLGLGLFFASLTVHFRDVKDLLATGLTLWFFGTPILYTISDVASPPLRRLLGWNPVAPLFAAWHDALFYGHWIGPGEWARLAGISLAAFLAGSLVFARLRDSYPEAV
ncbi:MAG TPA: ABC transporter permease [Thermoanaerobaculia bacterium]|nr:ABC transporter permease [Thermoanaerobaculia bacterium]HQR68724.1 ABC transporter permease [Thermoanaerobaculia bacterium]